MIRQRFQSFPHTVVSPSPESIVLRPGETLWLDDETMDLDRVTFSDGWTYITQIREPAT